MKKSTLKEKSAQFAVEIIEICRICRDTKVEYSLYNQLLRSGTAIGALVNEAEFAQSKADFISKLSIALKEAGETKYWLNILSQSGKIEQLCHEATFRLLDELIKMLTSSLNTLKYKA